MQDNEAEYDGEDDDARYDDEDDYSEIGDGNVSNLIDDKDAEDNGNGDASYTPS